MSVMGVVGVGTMGSRVARALADDAHEVVVHDRDAQRAQAVASEVGGEAASGVQEVAKRTEIVLLSLPGPPEVRAVVADLLGGDAVPGTVVDLSTVDPATTRAGADQARARGVGYLDAPVLGRPHRCGHWTLPVGGTAEDLDAVRPALEILSDRIVHAGASGAGNVIKLVNNLMFGAINAITVESVSVARRLGVDLRVLYDAIAESNAATVSNLFREIVPKMIDGDTSPDFTIDLLQKDCLLALDMAHGVQLPLVVGSAVTCLNALGQDRGDGQLDTSALIRVFDGDRAPRATSAPGP